MTQKSNISDPLETLFAQAREADMQAPDALLARVLEDGLALMPDPVIEPQVAPVQANQWAGFWDLIGGWPSATGLAAASVTGVWMGLMPPEGLSTLLDTATGAETALWLDTLADPVQLADEVSG